MPPCRLRRTLCEFKQDLCLAGHRLNGEKSISDTSAHDAMRFVGQERREESGARVEGFCPHCLSGCEDLTRPIKMRDAYQFDSMKYGPRAVNLCAWLILSSSRLDSAPYVAPVPHHWQPHSGAAPLTERMSDFLCPPLPPTYKDFHTLVKARGWSKVSLSTVSRRDG